LAPETRGTLYLSVVEFLTYSIRSISREQNGTYQSPILEGIVITSRSGYEGIVLLAQVLESDGKWVSLAVYDHYLSAEHTSRRT